MGYRTKRNTTDGTPFPTSTTASLAGGVVGDHLVKLSATDHDYGWATYSAYADLVEEGAVGINDTQVSSGETPILLNLMLMGG
jgi:hypothetical protein